jgi:hypothetical protein
MNSLSRILYTPEYLASKGWESGLRVHDFNLHQIIFDITYKMIGDYDKALSVKTIVEPAVEQQFQHPIKKLNVFLKRLWKILQPHLPEKITWQEFNKVTRTQIEDVFSQYQDEQEWLVKDAVLKVPMGSFLFINMFYLPRQLKFDSIVWGAANFEEFEKNIQNLKDKYKISFFTDQNKILYAANRIPTGQAFQELTIPWEDIYAKWGEDAPAAVMA